MSDATNFPNPIGSDKSMTPTEKASELRLEDLTDQNWLFIKHYLETNDIRTAYKLAKYEGEAPSLPYNMFKRMKPYIEDLLSHSISRIRLLADLDRALALPLSLDKASVSVSEWLRLRKFAGSLVPELKEHNKVSVLVVNRYQDKGPKEQEVVDTILHQQSDSSNIITIEPLSNDPA